MVDPTLRLFFSSLVVFPHPFRFFRLPFGCSHTVLFIHFCVVFHTLVLNKPVVFGTLFCFSRLLFALSASLFASSSCGFLSIPLCLSRPFGVAPFLVFVLTFLVSPINCSFLLLHSFCFVGPFGFLPPPCRFPSHLRPSGPHLPLTSRTR